MSTASIFTESFEEIFLPNSAYLPNSAHKSVPFLYQFLVLTGRPIEWQFREHFCQKRYSFVTSRPPTRPSCPLLWTHLESLSAPHDTGPAHNSSTEMRSPECHIERRRLSGHRVAAATSWFVGPAQEAVERRDGVRFPPLDPRRGNRGRWQRGYACCFYPSSIFKSTPTSNGEGMGRK
jgi:hypothetical protein